MDEILAHMERTDRLECEFDLYMLGYCVSEKISDEPAPTVTNTES
jgi:hypothetical protein